MKLDAGRLILSATDLSNFLGCRHRTALEMAAAAGKITRPHFDDPQLEALFKRGLEHEHTYVESLSSGNARVVDLGGEQDRDRAVAATLDAMRDEADVVVQAALTDGRWYGRPDVLKKIPGRSRFGSWSYEVEDTKLARETRAGAILQLGLYCEMLEEAQGSRPEHFRVVTPHGTHAYRVDDFAAYFRLIRTSLDAATSRADEASTGTSALDLDDALAAANYPEPCDLCDMCPWDSRCSKRRRADDHLSLVAGISRVQRRELERRDISTLTALAGLTITPLPFKPKRGAADTYIRMREQARLQLEATTEKRNVFELLPVVAGDKPEGLCRLPEPSAGDIFLDLEGAPFAGAIGQGGREYLFGMASVAPGLKTRPPFDQEITYRACWAETAADEKRVFEEVVDLINRAREAHPGMHVYHYAPYEPSAFKRLMGRHATREQDIDALLRSNTFVDLYAIVRQSLRAGVERYSIKNMEPFYDFPRRVDLKEARRHLQAMELALEMDCLPDLAPEVRTSIEGYNRDDCVSTLHLRNWLESLRAELTAKGEDIPRPVITSGEPSEALGDHQQRVEGLRMQLLSAGSEDPASIGPDPARRLLAYLLDWHRREDKAVWWEYFRLLKLPDEDLLDEPGAVAGLEYVADVGKVKRSTLQRFRFPPQEIELRRGDELKLKDDKVWGGVQAIDRLGHTIDVLVGPSKLDWRPTSAFAHNHVRTDKIEDAIFSIGEGVVAGTADPLALELLYARPPKARVVTNLHESVLAIQGPPGAGKTYTGGTMICDLVAAGRTVGICATGHKVIRNLLDAVSFEAAKRGTSVRLAHKVSEEEADEDLEDAAGETDGRVRKATVIKVGTNPAALALLDQRDADVLGGTAWLWARPEFGKRVDVLFIDEAGQMSLANALAVTQAAHSLVMLGDPQQLEQPQKGSHPDGVGISALQHMLGDHKTMPEERGMFLPETWRFGSALCGFTSEVFYEGKLRPTTRIGLERQRLSGGPCDGAGLWVVEVEHDGNRNASDEEVEVVGRLVEQLLAPGSMWTDADGVTAQMTPADILVVSPYNAHVSRLTERLTNARATVEVGTVDRFQGRQAPVVIYSMATSRPEDAPRGMEFLYNLNRLNVATSRARCAAIIVASPRLFAPECRSPRQMQLASALCRFRELATVIQI